MVEPVSAAEVQRFPEPDESEGPGTSSPAPRPLKASLSTTLWSAWGWFTFGLACLIAFPLMLLTWAVTAPFDKGRYWVGYIFRKVCVFQQVLLPRWKFTVSGTMPANPRNPYIAVCNHESFADILLIIEPMGLDLEFAKGEGPVIHNPVRSASSTATAAPRMSILVSLVSGFTWHANCPLVAPANGHHDCATTHSTKCLAVCCPRSATQKRGFSG
jgi:hypothetical protein